MRPRARHCLAVIALAVATASAEPAPTLSQRLEGAGVDYTTRLTAATEALNAARAAIAAQRVPLVERNQELQQQIVALQTELLLLRTEAAQADYDRQQLSTESEELRRSLSYIRSTVDERLQHLESALLPGEPALRTLPDLRANLQSTAHLADPRSAAAGLELAWQRIEQSLGGYRVPGEALADGSNAIHTGTFALIGPESYFRSTDGRVSGLARPREGGRAVVHRLAQWEEATAEALMRGAPASFPADVLGGKALRLSQAQGTWWDHLRKGGLIGYVILGLGGIAIIIVLWKFVDLRALAVDRPERVRPVLTAVREGPSESVQSSIRPLRATTRELFTTALEHVERPKSVIEEQLYALILKWRLHHERRLPLLAVIVTASPLLGLLGTVTGMVKTFTLITVFGTGSADKLASGISEALVTTQLGLTIAIPTLIVLGYLSQRVKKQLALLERYAVEFVAASEARKNQVVAVPLAP